MTALYPSYKDLDPLIDVARLQRLDAYVRRRLEPRIGSAADIGFYTGPFIAEEGAATVPGSRMVYLSQSQAPEDYYDLDRTDLWQPTPEADEFRELTDFIATLPFEATGRIIIMYDASGRAVTAHRDHDSEDLCHEFIWFRTNRDKPFYMQDAASGEKLYVASHAAWFDTVNQFHGADATGELSWSIRVDGRFTDAFRSHIPWPHSNPASAPSLWASQEAEPARLSLSLAKAAPS